MNRYILDTRANSSHFPGIGRYVRNLQRTLPPLLADTEKVRFLNPAVSPFGLRQQWTIPHHLRQAKQAVYHSPYYLMPYRVPNPTVVTLYDFIPLLYPEHVSARARLLFRAATRMAIGAADHIITISEASRRDLQRLFDVPAEQITVTPLAPASQFRPNPPPHPDLPAHNYLLYLGINKPHKNLLKLIEAYSLLKHAPPLLIAGSWDTRYPESKQRVATLGLEQRVRFLGRISAELQPSLYANATAFVFPSVYEGFGLPVIEAMACGAAVACSNRSSLPEAGGDAAAYFDPTSAESIAATLDKLIHDDSYRAERQAASLRQSAAFSWEQTAAQTLGVYRQLAQ